jgi:PEP-CTERM motif
MKKITLPQALAVGALLSAVSLSAQTTTLNFTASTDYTDNFIESASNPTLIGWNAAGYVQRDAGASTSSALYNPTSTAGIDNFTNVSLSADIAFSTTSTGGLSTGFYTNVNSAGTSGYAAVFRMESSTSFSFRLFDSNGDPSTAGVGTQIGTTQTITGSFAANTFYNARLLVSTVGADVSFSASFYTTGGTLIGNFGALTDTSAAVVGGGQVGIRMGSIASHTGRLDNFSITAIPEPSSFAAFAGLGVLGLTASRRRRSRG